MKEKELQQTAMQAYMKGSQLKTWWDESDSIDTMAYAYMLRDSMRKTMIVPKELMDSNAKYRRELDDIDAFIKKRTLSATYIVADKELRYMRDERQAKEFTLNHMAQSMAQQMKPLLTVSRHEDMRLYQTSFHTEMVCMTRKDLEELLNEVAARSAP